MTSDENEVVVRRRWNGPDTAVVTLDSLWDLHVRDDPGGVGRKGFGEIGLCFVLALS